MPRALVRDRTFFEELASRAGMRQQENQVSSTFAACFRASNSFRTVILDLLRRRFGLARLGPSSEWRVDCEVQAPQHGHGRPDLCLRTAHPSSSVKEIWIERKVEAALTLKQVEKYLASGIRHLAVITKYAPEVTSHQLAAKGVRALRWQEVHQLLEDSAPRSPVERWIATSFNEYLEAQGMARQHPVTLAAIRDVQRLFAVLRANRTARHVRGGFDTAGHVLSILRDVRNRVTDRFPEAARLRRSGPALLTHVDVDTRNHLLYTEFQKQRWQDWQFQFGISLPIDVRTSPEWYVALSGRRVQNERDDGGPLGEIASNGRVDADKLERKVTSAIQSWRVSVQLGDSAFPRSALSDP